MYRFSGSGIKIGIDFQTLVSSWYIDGSNFCFEVKYKINQNFGAPAAPPYPNVHGVNPPGYKDVVKFKENHILLLERL